MDKEQILQTVLACGATKATIIPQSQIVMLPITGISAPPTSAAAMAAAGCAPRRSARSMS